MVPRRVLQLQLIGLGLLAALLPFELKTPIGTFGPIVLTNVEALLYILIVGWIVGVLYLRRMQWTLVHSAVLVWLGVQFIAAILAPVEREAALKFALRSAGGAALFFVAADWMRSGRRVAWIMSAICGSRRSAIQKTSCTTSSTSPSPEPSRRVASRAT